MLVVAFISIEFVYIKIYVAHFINYACDVKIVAHFSIDQRMNQNQSNTIFSIIIMHCGSFFFAPESHYWSVCSRLVLLLEMDSRSDLI